MEKYDYSSWQKLSKQLIDTKDNIQELSKLYIIAHEKVKSILRRCQTDFSYDPKPDCQEQLQFLQKVLKGLDAKMNDQYLSSIDPQVLRKYQQNFLSLVQMVQVALLTNQSKINVIPSLLNRVKKPHRQQPYGLKSQVKASQERMKRTKSGKKITKQTPILVDYQEIPQKNITLEGSDEHLRMIEEKQNNIEKMVNSQIEKKGSNINFKKKYDNLDKYLNERKEFADLLFCQHYYDNLIFEGRARKNETKVLEKKNTDINKIFPQFNIKTKYLKPQVKQNILQVILDVKKQLLKDFHEQNLQKMRAQNQGNNVKIDQRLFQKKKVKSAYTQTCPSDCQSKKRFLSTNRPLNKFRETMKSLKTTAKTGFQNQMWDQETDRLTRKKVERRFSVSRMPVYKK